MAMIGGGKIAPLGGASELQLSSSTSIFDIKDQDGFQVFKVDTSGNVYIRGAVKKI